MGASGFHVGFGVKMASNLVRAPGLGEDKVTGVAVGEAYVYMACVECIFGSSCALTEGHSRASR